MATLKIWETVRADNQPVIRLDERVTYQTVTFTATAGQSSAFDASKPYLIAQVLDRDSDATLFQQKLMVSTLQPFVYFNIGSGGKPLYKHLGSGQDIESRCEETAMASGTVKVYWTYYDPVAGQIRSGVNQVENTTQGPLAYTATGTGNRSVIVGSDTSATPYSNMKHGSIQVVNRTGLTLAQAKAIVQNMQTLHGI